MGTSIAPGAGVLPVPRMSLLLGLLVLLPLAAADPYLSWTQNRPAESAAALERLAHSEDVWHRWLDASLAWQAAGSPGRAAAAALRAHLAAPEAEEPRRTLRLLGTGLPGTLCERLGPLTWPGVSWRGLPLALLGGLLLGLGLALPRRQPRLALLGGLLLLAVLPGSLAVWLDGRRPWAVVVADSQACDSTGTPLSPVAAGTLVTLPERPVWAGRRLALLPDGRQAYIASGDLAGR